MKKTKMVCTIGPKSEKREIMETLLNSGMNVMRLNFSHGDFEEHGGRITNINAIMQETGKVFAVLLDTKGPEIRTCDLENGEDVSLVTGDKITLTSDSNFVGNKTKVGVTYPNLAKDLKVGATVLLDDGLIGLKVIEINGDDVVCEVQNNGELGEHKGVNLPNTHISMPFLSEKDKGDLLFGIKRGVDFIAASFTRTKEDVLDIRNFLDANGGNDIKIICKIENQEGLDNFEDILATADGIMVARGDIGVEIPAQDVIFAQKHIIKRCNQVGKPVITATQMLDSMIRNPRPTRAEATDVANAIFQGTSATMLSGETAAGKYPVQALQMMSRIAEHMEQNIDYNTIFKKTDRNENPDITNAIAHATCLTAIDLKASAILSVTKSGSTAHMMSKHRPGCLIGACTSSERVLRQLNLSWGVYPMLIKEEYSSEILCLRAIEAAQKHKLVKVGDTIVFAGGVPLGIPGRTNLIRVCTVE